MKEAPLPLLIQLPDGNWIELTQIASIRAEQKTDRNPIGRVYPDRVEIKTRGTNTFTGELYTLRCESWEEAQQMRDRLAAQVNESREKWNEAQELRDRLAAQVNESRGGS